MPDARRSTARPFLFGHNQYHCHRLLILRLRKATVCPCSRVRAEASIQTADSQALRGLCEAPTPDLQHPAEATSRAHQRTRRTQTSARLQLPVGQRVPLRPTARVSAPSSAITPTSNLQEAVRPGGQLNPPNPESADVVLILPGLLWASVFSPIKWKSWAGQSSGMSSSPSLPSCWRPQGQRAGAEEA